MSEKVPTMSPDHSVRFASAAALSAALPALKSGTLVVRGPALEKGQTLQVRLGVDGAQPVADSRASVVAVMGDRMILRMHDVEDRMLASLHSAAGLEITPVPEPIPHYETPAKALVAAARHAIGRITRTRRAVTLSAVLHPSGHIEVESPKALLARLDQIQKDGFIDVEWAAETHRWQRKTVFLHARNHPAVVDLKGDAEPLSGRDVRIHFRDRDALMAAILGLKQSLTLASHPIQGLPQLPILDGTNCVRFTTGPAVMALMPQLFRLGSMRVRWTGGARPPAGVVDIAIALEPLKGRAHLRGWFSPVEDGLVTITLDATEDSTTLLNQWLTRVRERTTAKLRAVKARSDG